MKKYRIQISGQRDPIEVDQAQGLKIKTLFEDPAVAGNELIRTKNFTAVKNSIRSVVVFDDQTTEINTKDQKLKDRDLWIKREIEHLGNVEAVRALPIEQRAKQLGMFNMIFSAFEGREPNEEEKNQAIKIQSEFFASRPNMTTCDPMLFRPTMNEHRGQNNNEEYVAKLAGPIAVQAFVQSRKLENVQVSALRQRYEAERKNLGVAVR